MINVHVCVGSSCHLKGSYAIIEWLKENVASKDLSEKVALNAAFCLGKCTNGVTMKIDDEIVCGVTKENIPEIFDKYVVSHL